ncbi:MAG TPA: sulfite exporter TauE/SafE family protein [Stellaceae bacterium]
MVAYLSGLGDIGSIDLLLFLATSFAASLAAGLAGFAFGIVAAAIWLHILTPVQTTALIVAYGLLVQGWAVWKLRHALNPPRLLPFVVGGSLGVPIGADILRWTSAAQLRAGVGILMILFSLYGLARPKLRSVAAGGRAADGIVGLASGVLGSATGLGGILPTVWCGLRGWSKDEQRAVFQPVAVAIFAMTALWLGGTGLLTADALRLFAIGLPAILAGLWLGLKLYGHLGEAGFRNVVLALLLISGVVLVIGTTQS